MSILTEAVATTGGHDEHSSYVDWPAIFGGIVLASAISLVLLTFGAALGLSLSTLGTSGGVPVIMAICATLWLLWVQVSSFMAGGYLTGRMRRRFYNVTPHESDVRDGAHGLLVWGGALVIGAIIAVSGVGAAATALGNAVGTATIAASSATDNGVTKDPNAYFVDSLFRSDRPDQAGDSRAEVMRILANAGMEPVPADDRAYITRIVAQDTGMSQDEAEARVNQVMTKVEQAKADTIKAAEAARKIGIIAAFLTAASLLVSAAGAYWAAGMGGRHRDEGIVFDMVFRRI